MLYHRSKMYVCVQVFTCSHVFIFAHAHLHSILYHYLKYELWWLPTCLHTSQLCSEIKKLSNEDSYSRLQQIFTLEVTDKQLACCKWLLTLKYILLNVLYRPHPPHSRQQTRCPEACAPHEQWCSIWQWCSILAALPQSHACISKSQQYF